MPSVTVPNVPEDVLRRLDQHAAAAGLSREAVAEAILTDGVAADEAWDRFEVATRLVGRSLAGRVLRNSVDDLADARRDRNGPA